MAAFWATRFRETELREREPAGEGSFIPIPIPTTGDGTANIEASKCPKIDQEAISLNDCLAAETRRDWVYAFAGAKVLADNGNAEAALTVYRYYSSGIGVFKDQGNAVRYLVHAAELGSPAAQNDLANRYMTGNGLERDSRKAYYWWLLAVARSVYGAKYNLERAELELSEYERNAIQADAQRWWEKNSR